MKPRTIIQRAVVELQDRLSPLSWEEEKEARERIFLNYCYKNKTTAHCLECSHSIDLKYIGRKKTITCPNCDKRLKVETTLKRTLDIEGYYFSKAEVIEYDKYSFQIIRNFYASKYCSKGEKARVSIYEVCQNWYDENSGKRTIYSRLEQWHGFQGDMEIRKEGYYRGYDPFPALYLSTSKFMDKYIKHGISWKMSTLRFSEMKRSALNCSKTETLLKANYFEVLHKFRDNLYRSWPALKIMMRNKYKPKDVGIYYDYIEMLCNERKDLSNAFYVCPKNLQQAHDDLLSAINKKRAKEQAKNERLKIEKEAKANASSLDKFIEEKSKYFGLLFMHKNIKIEVLTSLEDFILESEIMKHCLLRSKYMSRTNSLILRASVNNKPMETIEVCLLDFKVLQSRGKHNQATKHHDQIVALMNSNMIEVKKLALNEKQLKTA